VYTEILHVGFSTPHRDLPPLNNTEKKTGKWEYLYIFVSILPRDLAYLVI
jgi:hypothetical protein